ncbi:MAG: SRPBCC family protein [Polyangiaceae bacterium]|jgi:hypothetical protein
MTPSTPSTPKAQKTQHTFRMACAITVNIRAPAERLWAILTDAAGFARWNSTVSSVGGTIADGQRLELKVPTAPDRTFRPRVTISEPGKSMVWSDGMAPMFKGVRTFTLAPQPDGSTDFAMSEVFSGVMLPMIKGSLPDFGPVFEAYAADLKREGETSKQ